MNDSLVPSPPQSPKRARSAQHVSTLSHVNTLFFVLKLSRVKTFFLMSNHANILPKLGSCM